MAALDSDGQQWLAVIGRALAFLSLHAAELRDRDIGEQAAFLQSLGLSKEEIAPLVGSTPASIEVLLRRRNKGKGAKRARKASTKSRNR